MVFACWYSSSSFRLGAQVHKKASRERYYRLSPSPFLYISSSFVLTALLSFCQWIWIPMMFSETMKMTQRAVSIRFSIYDCCFFCCCFFFVFGFLSVVLLVSFFPSPYGLGNFGFNAYQEKESNKELVVYLVDASPKMFNTTCPAVSFLQHRDYSKLFHYAK